MRESAPKPVVKLGQIPEGFNVERWFSYFVVVQRGRKLTLHIGKKGELTHRDVVLGLADPKIKHENVRGGKVEIENGKLRFYSTSDAYGGVSPQIMELFRVDLESLPGITEVVFKTFE